jgi:tetratricopeptide (TPR) repeat protein
MTESARRIAQLQRELTGNPASRQFYQLGELLRRDGRSAEAAEALQAGLAHHPRYVAAWVALGRACLDAAQAPEAVGALQQALALDAQNPVAWRLLGEGFLAVGDRPAALDAMRRSLELVPGDDVLQAAVDALSAEVGAARPAEVPPAARPAAGSPAVEELPPATVVPPPVPAEPLQGTEPGLPPVESAAAARTPVVEAPAGGVDDLFGGPVVLEAPAPPAAPEVVAFQQPPAVPQATGEDARANAPTEAPAPLHLQESAEGLLAGSVEPGAVPPPPVETVEALEPPGPPAVAEEPSAVGTGDAELFTAPEAEEAPVLLRRVLDASAEKAAAPIPLQPPASLTLARLYVQQQALTEAVAVLERLLEREPQNIEARDLLALVRDMMEPLPAAPPALSARERTIASLQRWLASLTLGRERAAR